jgi:hypothetical protein
VEEETNEEIEAEKEKDEGEVKVNALVVFQQRKVTVDSYESY